MKLLSFLQNKNTAPVSNEQFIALQIGTRHSKAAIWSDRGSEVEIETVVNGLTPEEVIRKATESFSVTKVLFGLPDEYVAEDKIKDDRLPQLKRIAESFSLTPLGFVVIPEAISHMLEMEAGAPPTALFATVGSDKINISLIRVGKMTHTVTVSRTDSVVTDFEQALVQFTDEEVLPSKIIIDNEDTTLTNLKEELLNYPWQTNEKFLHVPKIELLPWEYSIEAVVQAGVSEMSEAPALATAESPADAPDELSTDTDTETSHHTLHKTEEVDTDIDDLPEKEPEETINPSAAALGFSTQSSPTAQPVTAVDSGPVTISPRSTPLNSTPTATPQTPTTPRRGMPKFSLPELPKLSFPSQLSLAAPQKLLPAAVAVVLVIATAALTVFYPKSTITLLAQPEEREEEVQIVLNTSASDIDTENGEIPGRVHSVTVSAKPSAETTGSKTIGEKATGTVTILNKSTSERTFSAGTVLSASGVSFTLDEEVKVASASDTGTSLEYGKKDASVTAAAIGPKGNISGDTELSIKDVSSSTATAKSTGDFSGGTERQINVVSEEDQEGLVLGATDELKDEAREQLKSQIDPSEKFLDESIAENIVEQSFDADIGDETENLTLDLVLEISQTSYSVSDINRYLESYMQKEIKEGYTLDTEKSYFRVIETEQDDDGTVTFTANYHAFMLPDVSVDGLNGRLAGSSTKKLEDLVNGLTDQNIVGYEVTQNRKLPFLSSRLPFLKNNITIEVEMYE